MIKKEFENITNKKVIQTKKLDAIDYICIDELVNVTLINSNIENHSPKLLSPNRSFF